jgi:hypothetical protein
MAGRLSEQLTRKDVIDQQYEKFAVVMARVGGLRTRMSEAERQVAGRRVV